MSTVLVYGLGRSGLAVTRLLHDQGHAVEFFESREAGEDVTEALESGARRVADVNASTAAVCIAAPGVRIDHPDLVSLRDRGTEVIGEVEWVARSFPDSPLVGVTGTAGKGTVTSWIAHTLRLAGTDVEAGGNLDPALAAVARPGATLVVELSSFQLERVPGLRPGIAIALNLGSDHLDRHGSIDAYHSVKRNLIRNLTGEELLIYNADDEALVAWADSSSARTAGFSLRAPAAAHLAGGMLYLRGAPLMPSHDLGIPGTHNVANALAVALACAALGLTPDAIRTGLASYTGLRGRYSAVTNVGGITYIEDSIATRPLSVLAALESSPAPVVWLAGGRSKGADIREFAAIAKQKVSLFIGFGESGEAFCAGLSDTVPVLHLPHADGRAALRAAVKAADAHLRAHAARGGTVLLAPLATSFDQFGDYAERGQAFRDEALRMEAMWTRYS